MKLTISKNIGRRDIRLAKAILHKVELCVGIDLRLDPKDPPRNELVISVSRMIRNEFGLSTKPATIPMAGYARLKPQFGRMVAKRIVRNLKKVKR